MVFKRACARFQRLVLCRWAWLTAHKGRSDGGRRGLWCQAAQASPIALLSGVLVHLPALCRYVPHLSHSPSKARPKLTWWGGSTHVRQSIMLSTVSASNTSFRPSSSPPIKRSAVPLSLGIVDSSQNLRQPPRRGGRGSGALGAARARGGGAGRGCRVGENVIGRTNAENRGAADGGLPGEAGPAGGPDEAEQPAGARRGPRRLRRRAARGAAGARGGVGGRRDGVPGVLQPGGVRLRGDARGARRRPGRRPPRGAARRGELRDRPAAAGEGGRARPQDEPLRGHPGRRAALSGPASVTRPGALWDWG